ncbi:MAG: DUF4912 domain-containing protein [Firmicutes bacterium]|nr:DUF4912 domain-containing protein [Bacillota bacterium]MDH7494429.1 DUF4912 domain-containing protein [Bacillota bacterium]
MAAIVDETRSSASSDGNVSQSVLYEEKGGKSAVLGGVEEVRLPESVSELRIVETQELKVAEDIAHAATHPMYTAQTQTEPELPQGYGSTRLVLMVRDPFWLHAYWEIAHDVSETVTAALGPDGWLVARKTLRVHDVTDVEFDGTNAHRTFDIDVSCGANNWYINVDRPNRSYCAELGLIGPGGRFVLLSRSNVVRTPRAGPSEIIDEEWMTISAVERYYPHPGRLPSSPEMITARLEHMALEMGSGFVAGISSPGVGVSAPERKAFWLNASVEVIVHGATEPGSTVTIQGVPVRLRPDGTFSARFQLPDGQQVVPIEAVSKDGSMKRSITTRLARDTW